MDLGRHSAGVLGPPRWLLRPVGACLVEYAILEQTCGLVSVADVEFAVVVVVVVAAAAAAAE